MFSFVFEPNKLRVRKRPKKLVYMARLRQAMPIDDRFQLTVSCEPTANGEYRCNGLARVLKKDRLTDQIIKRCDYLIPIAVCDGCPLLLHMR